MLAPELRALSFLIHRETPALVCQSPLSATRLLQQGHTSCRPMAAIFIQTTPASVAATILRLITRGTDPVSLPLISPSPKHPACLLTIPGHTFCRARLSSKRFGYTQSMTFTLPTSPGTSGLLPFLSQLFSTSLDSVPPWAA